MRKQTFQTQVTTSAATLFFSVVACIVLWMWNDWSNLQRLGGLGLTLLTAYLMVEWNNTFSLMRVRSRMTSSTFLLLMAACPLLQTWTTQMLVPLSLLLCYFCLFRSYQKVRAEADFFHAFAFLGLGCLFFPQLLYFVPLLLVSCLVQLRSLSLRSFMACLLGLSLPYWCYAGYSIWHNQLDLTVLHFEQLLTLQMPDYHALTVSQVLSGGFVMAATMLATFHYQRTAYHDKIRTRMFLNLLVTQEYLIILLMVGQPQHFETMLRLLIVNSSPLIAHYLTLAKGRFFHIWFIFCLLLYAAFAVLMRFPLESWKVW